LNDADFNHDCIINFKDIAIFADQWQQGPGIPSADIAPPPIGNGIVDSKDLAVLTEVWLTAPPSWVTGPNPADGATVVDINADLSWIAGSDATSYDVYFSTSSSGTFWGNQTATTFEPGTMAFSTKYYWRIDTVNSYGKTTGKVWSFRTTGSGPG
jgi:hypothetical protein